MRTLMCLLLFAVPPALVAQWRETDYKSKYGISDMDFSIKDSIAVSTESINDKLTPLFDNRIFYSKNGGANWQQLAQLPPAEWGFISKVKVLGKNEWIIASDKYILRYWFDGQYFPDTVLDTKGNNGYISSTFFPKLADMCFINKDTGVYIFGNIYHTFDGGKTWKRLSTYEKIYADQMQFIENTGYAYFSDSAGWPMGLYKSVDYGVSWNKLDSIKQKGSISLRFITKDTGYVRSYDSLLYRTTDGGNNWSRYIPDGLKDKKIIGYYFLNSSIGWVNADKSQGLQKTADGGKSYFMQHSGIFLGTSKCLYAKDEQHAFLYSGKLYRTSNQGGSPYLSVNSPIAKNYERYIAYPNPTLGIVNITIPAQSTYNVYNIQGSRIICGQVEGEEAAVIDLSSYPAGMYFIKIITNTGTAQTIRVAKE